MAVGRHVGAAAALVCAALALGSAGSARPAATTVKGANGRIVLESRGLFLVNPDGSGRTRIPGTTGSDHNAAWSADGTQIVFESTRRTGDYELYAMSGNGSHVRELTFSPSFDADAAWYPDGTRIAFESDRAGNVDVWRMRSDGGSQTRLTDSPAFDGDPAVSPDGTRIAFTTERDGNREVYMMNADGSGQQRLTNTGGRVSSPAFDSVDENPSWSPDGTRIAFDSTRDGNWELYVMNADGSGQTRLTDHPALDARPVWSPDGRLIAFESERVGRGLRRVYVMAADGSNVRRLTAGQDVGADWQALGPRPRGCTIWGTAGDDLLVGTPRRDVICGGSGNDVIQARDGARDVVDGGPGRDSARVDRRLDRVRSIERRL
jgi:Tol biopolymer transport system component